MGDMSDTRIGLIMTQFLLYQYGIPIEYLVPLFSESLATSDIPTHRHPGRQEVNPELQTSFPPMGHIYQTYSLNFSINTEPFPTIPMAL